MKNKSYEKVITIQQFNQIMDELEFIKLDIKITKCNVSFVYDGCKYYCSLTGDTSKTPNVGNIMVQFSKYVKDIDYCLPEGSFGKTTIKLENFKSRVRWDIRDPGNYSYVNTDYTRRWLWCYSYDINSAYAFAMCKDMPDTSIAPRMWDTLGENEIGFSKEGEVTTKPGDWAYYIFPLIKSPFIKYVENYYNKKQKAPRGSQERDLWKDFLNIPTGMMHKKNIFIRNAILYYAASYIRQFIDKDTVYCNTDSIVSLKPRNDLPIGDKLGEFKEEHANEKFKFIDEGIYQWDNECHYKGIPGKALTDIENIENWESNLPYKYNEKTRRIEPNGKSY